MKLTPSQDKAAKAIDKWSRQRAITPGNWIFCLDGFAGTGKTTLMKHVSEGFDEMPIFCAPTNKAAAVLRTKLPPTAQVMTVHQLLYVPVDKAMNKLDSLLAERVALAADGAPAKELMVLDREINQERDRLANQKVNFATKQNLGRFRGKTVIIDEASMTTERMRDDLCAAGIRAMFVGDSFQIPPVNSKAWFSEAKKDVQLVDVMRQALDSPIIRLSMQIREGFIKQEEFRSGACRLAYKTELTNADWLTADQVITGSNFSRQKLNRFFRKQLARDHSHLPVRGDKLICLKNDMHKAPPWINGVQFVADQDCRLSPCGNFMGLNAEYEGVHFRDLEFYEYNCKVTYDDMAEVLDPEVLNGLFQCDYAYGITVHKAQGSEWPFVIIADDKMQQDNKTFRAKWLYTAVTRAKEKLILIQDGQTTQRSR